MSIYDRPAYTRFSRVPGSGDKHFVMVAITLVVTNNELKTLTTTKDFHNLATEKREQALRSATALFDDHLMVDLVELALRTTKPDLDAEGSESSQRERASGEAEQAASPAHINAPVGGPESPDASTRDSAGQRRVVCVDAGPFVVNGHRGTANDKLLHCFIKLWSIENPVLLILMSADVFQYFIQAKARHGEPFKVRERLMYHGAEVLLDRSLALGTITYHDSNGRVAESLGWQP